jgi:crossover junction endodeoxyribonuclease RusA
MIQFTVYGTPEAQGSTRAFMVKGRPIVTTTNKKTKPWRQEVARTAAATPGMKCWSRKDGGVNMTVVFMLARPGSLAKKYTVQNKRPDIDKLARAVLDALTGIAYEDDSQVCGLNLVKAYSTVEGVTIGIDFVSHNGSGTL